MNDKESLKEEVLEICGEDDYGSWELLWFVRRNRQDVGIEKLSDELLLVVSKMIKEKLLFSKERSGNGELSPCVFDEARLDRELKMSKSPDPENFYWFGTSI